MQFRADDEDDKEEWVNDIECAFSSQSFPPRYYENIDIDSDEENETSGEPQEYNRKEMTRQLPLSTIKIDNIV